ncbi:X-box-binding protein 1 [Cephus cinctus]|uniref:X-box-binding protein 1 n=1 Tax=Cephus cinctus TaxID=211228 RepID=A0AAJ7C8J8_CEPCN|nr:X-box-binding protein 1 [Cephus cinctus]
MSGLKSVIITLPKGLAKSVNPKLNFTTSILANKTKMDIRNVPQHMDEDSTDSSLFKSDVCLRGKKRRLDHLTWEEKLQRKKLKNRVAAQTSRDRKKAKLDELEESVRILQERNEQLSRECSVLRSTNESLMVENRKLRRNKSSEVEQPVCSACQARVGCATPTSGSAESPRNPLPQGGVAQPAQSLAKLSAIGSLTPAASALLRILTLYLLSKNSLLNSKETITSTDLRSLLKVFCEKLPLKWKQILLDQTTKLRSRKIPAPNVTIRQEWWGRHQKMWKPMEPMESRAGSPVPVC